jgi:hypothetical protein
MVHAEALERLRDARDTLGGPRRVGPRGADDGAAVEVDARQVVDRQLRDVVSVALDQPLEAVVAAEDAGAVVPGLDGRRRDDGVDSGGRAPADENKIFPFARICLVKRSTGGC